MREFLCGRTHTRASGGTSIPSTHAGFTLAELVVGIVLLTVGVGALSSTAAWVLYETAASRRAERAAGVGRTRLELVRLGACVSGSGDIDHDGLVERWRVSATRYAARVTVTVSYDERGRGIVQRYEGGFTC
jgi:Tfp pilus assembly protein PilV